MLRYLLVTTAVIAIAAPASAETISNAVTQPVRTSTIKGGAPDSITIASAGSVKPASGVAVTMDSNHAVTNQGTIAVSNANDSIGIRALADTTGDIVNSGTITIDEPYAPTDTDNDGDLDGPFALGSNRFGIRTEGAHTGKVTNSGKITVEGNDSAGIWLGGPLNGAFTHDGTTNVLGDRTTGIRADAITGAVRLAGTVGAQGEGAVGAHFAGDVTGAMVVQGVITSTGYRYTTAPADPSKLDADDLLQGGSALLIEGDVTGGIVLAVAPKDNNKDDPDEDKDGIEDAKEGNAAVTSFGEAPAMVIGAAGRDIAIGPVAGTSSQYGLIIEGAVNGNGVYAGVDGNGLLIGGRGGAVTIANGIGVSGTITAASKDANATALRLGAGANVPQVHVSGTISAGGGNSTTAVATAVQVDAGASLGTLRNAGTIRATAAGENGTAVAIRDLSGGLTLIENSGAIAATGAKVDSDRNIAIDLSANTTGVTVRQTQVGAGITAPSIAGDVRFGSGSDTLDIADGTVKGTVNFGGGNNTLKLSGDAVQTGRVVFGGGADAVTLAGTSRFDGTMDFGGGADTLSLADTAIFSGSLANAGGLSVSLTSGGALDLRTPASIGSLSVGEKGVLIATLDKEAGEGSLYNIAGTASFADGATIAVRLANVADAEGRYTILQAGSIAGLDDVETNTSLIPFMFKAEVADDTAANVIAVDVAKKTAQELELNRSQTSAYNAIYAALGADEDIENVFLGITDGNQFRQAVRQMLPDHAGGAFEGLSLGTRAFARQVADPQSPVYSLGGLDIVMGVAGWSSSKDEGATAAYDLGGFGFSAGGEVDTGLGAFGATLTWLWNEYDQGSDANRVLSDTYELAAYWRGQWGGLSAHARGSAGLASFSGRRTFTGKAGDKNIEKSARGKWDGTLFSFNAGAAYEMRGSAFFLRPGVSVDYLKLSEDGYTDTGAGEGLDLIVDKRSSDEFAVNGGVTVGLDFAGSRRGDSNWFRVEAEGGWREIVGGSIGSTTARFEDGTPFTLAADQTASGWYARARATGGSSMFEIGGEVGAEDRNDRTAMSLRGTLRMGF